MAGCYENLNRIQEAIKCYERAESNQDKEGIALNKLAKLYKELGDHEKSAYYYKLNLDTRDSEGVFDIDLGIHLHRLKGKTPSKHSLRWHYIVKIMATYPRQRSIAHDCSIMLAK